MLRAYEAVYTEGRLDWVTLRPDLPDGTPVLVVVEDKIRGALDEPGRRQVLDAAWGAWGKRKTPGEVDKELAALREEWERGWATTQP